MMKEVIDLTNTDRNGFETQSVGQCQTDGIDAKRDYY